jgi:hypothetical protein
VAGGSESNGGRRQRDSISMATRASPPPASFVLSYKVSLSIPSTLLSMVLEVGSWCVISRSLDLLLDLGVISDYGTNSCSSRWILGLLAITVLTVAVLSGSWGLCISLLR